MPTPHTLPRELTIYTVGELAPQWAGWLADASGPLPVDASQVSEVDTAGLQLLLALAQSCQQRGHTLTLLDAARPLVQAAEALGLHTLIAPSEGARS